MTSGFLYVAGSCKKNKYRTLIWRTLNENILFVKKCNPWCKQSAVSMCSKVKEHRLQFYVSWQDTHPVRCSLNTGPMPRGCLLLYLTFSGLEIKINIIKIKVKNKIKKTSIYINDNWVFASNLNFQIFSSDVVNLWYFKLRLFDLTELRTLEWWISGLMLDPLFFLISRLNNTCSPLVINLQINLPTRIKDIPF